MKIENKESRYNTHIVTTHGAYIWNLYSGYIMQENSMATLLSENNEIYRKAHFYVADEIDEIELIEKEEHKLICNRDNYFRMTIMLTKLCNYNCVYCYQETHNSEVISDEVIVTITQYVKNHLDKFNYKGIRVNWYGGEPLLCIDSIRKITHSLIAICKNKNISYKASMETNGSLLLDAGESFVKETFLDQVQITVDGMLDYYTHVKKATCDNFESVVMALTKFCDIIDIKVRINYDDFHKNEVYKLINYLLDERKLNKKIKIYVAPIVISSENFSAKQERNGKYWMFMKEFVPYYTNKYGEGTLIYEKPIRRRIYCSSVMTDSIVVDYRGRIFNCSHDCSNQIRCRGYIGDEHWLDNVYEKVIHSKECKECSFFPVCMGGCLSERVEKNQIINCEAYKDYMKSIMKFILEKNNVKFLQ